MGYALGLQNKKLKSKRIFNKKNYDLQSKLVNVYGTPRTWIFCVCTKTLKNSSENFIIPNMY